MNPSRGASSLPRVLTMQDFSCFGRCSLTVALPVISAAGAQVCAVPTEVLSTHTGYEGAVARSLDNELPAIIDHLISLDVSFEVLYTGYLANARQAGYVCRLADEFCVKGALLAVDPAMADGGRLYGGLDESVAAGMKRLCARADVVMPNLTEAALLTGRDYDPSPGAAAVDMLLDALLALGAKSAIITGVSRERGRVGAAVRGSGSRETQYFDARAVPGGYHGSGDLFASVVAAALARGCSLAEAARLAVAFTARCLELTHNAGTDEREGVRFEPLLGSLARAMDAALENGAGQAGASPCE